MCILFVEDEAIVLMIAEEALQDAGHEVMVARRGDDAVRLIERHPGHFTCLVSDLRMPGELSGADVVEHMRARYPVIPIFLATGTPGDVPASWIQQHAVAVIDKPYSLGALVDAVEGGLEAGSPGKRRP